MTAQTRARAAEVTKLRRPLKAPKEKEEEEDDLLPLLLLPRARVPHSLAKVAVDVLYIVRSEKYFEATFNLLLK